MSRRGRRSHRANSRDQKVRRHRRGERAFLFDADVTQCLGEVDLFDWEIAIVMSGGDVQRAARECDLDVPPGAKALWGKSREEASGNYRRWRKRKQKSR